MHSFTKCQWSQVLLKQYSFCLDSIQLRHHTDHYHPLKSLPKALHMTNGRNPNLVITLMFRTTDRSLWNWSQNY